MNNTDTAQKLKPEDQDFFDYLQFNAMRSNNALPPNGLEEIKKITEREKRAKALEDLYQKVIRNEESVDSYNSLYEDFKTALEKSINDTLSGKKELSDKSKSLIEYFKLEVKKYTSELSEEEIKKLENIRQTNQNVRTIEEAHRRVKNKEIPAKVLRTIREKYKTDVKKEIAELELNEAEYLPDDSAIYTLLDELTKQETTKQPAQDNSANTILNIAPILNIKKQKEEQAKILEEKANKIKETKAQESKGEVIKNIIDEKMTKQDEKITKLNENGDDLYDLIAKKEKLKLVAKKENDKSELIEENKRLREENELLKTKIDFLKEQIRELNRDIAIHINREEMPREFVELAKYFKLDLKRSRSEISDEEMNDLRELTRGNNPMINEIENTVRMKANGELSIKEFNEEHSKVYNKYKTELEEKYNDTKRTR